MRSRVTDEQRAQLRALLLNQLAAEHAAPLAEQIMLDATWQRALQRVEAELREDYQQHRLDPATRAAMESQWLSAQRPSRPVDIALSLARRQRRSSVVPPRRSKRWRITVAVVLAAGLFILLALNLASHQ